MSSEKPKLTLESPPPRIPIEPVLPVESDLTPLPGVRGKDKGAVSTHAGTAWFLLLVLILFHVVANLAWLKQDRHVIRTDEEGHMQIARAYHETLFVTPYPNLVERIIAIGDIRPGNPAHPPLLSILGALMIRVFGYHPDIIAATTTVLFALLILGFFLLARRILNPWEALFAAFVVSFTPMIYASSRFFMTDFLSATITVWAIYALLKSRLFRHTGWLFFFGLLNGLGFMARINTFLYYIVPAAFIALAGLWAVLATREEEGRRWRKLGLLTLNAIVTLVVTFGVCAPWYFHHLDTFYTFWTQTHASGGPLASKATEPGPLSTVVPAAIQIAQAIPNRLPACLSAIREHFLHPGEPWLRYPVYLINNGVFLPTFFMGLLGFLCALAHRRFRGLPAFTIILWVLGAWVLMTILFKNSTPRYALPFAGGFTLLAALAILSPPWRWIRGLLVVLFSALLLFQYGNLTARSYGTYGRMAVAAEIDPTAQMRYGGDQGLVLWKDILVFGESFARLSAPVDDNYKERLFDDMVADEKRGKANGEFANYLRVRVRGMEFDERHYWPSTKEAPNPYARRDWTPDRFPARKLRSIGMGDSPEEVAGKLDGADYLVYYIREGEEALEARWHQYLVRRGFQRLDRFFMPRSGGTEDRIYGVYGRKVHNIDVTRATIDQLNLVQLYQLQYAWGRFSGLEPALQQYARNRFQELLRREAAPVKLNDEVSVIPLGRRRIDAKTVAFDLLFHVNRAMKRDWDILFIGKVGKEDIGRLPANKQIQGYMDWNFEPSPPTTRWREGDYVLITHQVEAEPMSYFIQVGILSPSGAPHGTAADLGWIDFSKE